MNTAQNIYRYRLNLVAYRPTCRLHLKPFIKLTVRVRHDSRGRITQADTACRHSFYSWPDSVREGIRHQRWLIQDKVVQLLPSQPSTILVEQKRNCWNQIAFQT